MKKHVSKTVSLKEKPNNFSKKKYVSYVLTITYQCVYVCKVCTLAIRTPHQKYTVHSISCISLQ
jgi:hypothetical protein